MKVKVTLALSSTSNAQVLLNATQYTNAITASSFFDAADIEAQVAATVEATASLREALNKPLSESKNDQIKASRNTLDRQLTILAGKVEAVANHPKVQDEQRQAIVHSAGMDLKGIKSAGKRVFTVENSKIEGTVVLTASGGASGHEWQYAQESDNYANRVYAPGTTTASTKIPKLERGKKYAFFHKPIVAGKNTEWEGPLFLIVS